MLYLLLTYFLERTKCSVSSQRAPSNFYELLTLGEDLSIEKSGALCKIVHMPQDRDILFIIWRRKSEFVKRHFLPFNERHTFEAYRLWKRNLVQCQAWYFSVLLRERCYTREELYDKIAPFLSQDGARHLLAPVMIRDAKRIVAGNSESLSCS